jgi:hypothetical protein
MAKRPKVLVGCPTSNHKAYCLDKYLEVLQGLTYADYDVLLVDNSEGEEYSKTIKQKGVPVVKATHFPTARERIVVSRNLLRKEVLEKGYDYFLSLEQDVIPPKDVIERLLQHDKKVVSGVYFTKYTLHGQEVLKPLLWDAKEGEEMEFVAEEEVEKEQLLQVKAAGLGCVLIHKDVLEKIPFRLFTDRHTYDDMAFCSDLHKEGIPLYVDTSVKCKHLISGMDWSKIKE